MQAKTKRNETKRNKTKQNNEGGTKSGEMKTGERKPCAERDGAKHPRCGIIDRCYAPRTTLKRHRFVRAFIYQHTMNPIDEFTWLAIFSLNRCDSHACGLLRETDSAADESFNRCIGDAVVTL